MRPRTPSCGRAQQREPRHAAAWLVKPWELGCNHLGSSLRHALHYVMPVSAGHSCLSCEGVHVP